MVDGQGQLVDGQGVLAGYAGDRLPRREGFLRGRQGIAFIPAPSDERDRRIITGSGAYLPVRPAPD